MSQSVDRLKELLFDSEARTLSDLQTRVDTVFERAGTAERFTSSVAGVLDDALRRAEVDRHAELADAIAPLIVRTVKTEIRNSQDELVEALYPMTGRMVKAYVASAMKDLANDINRRLEANPVMLRLRSLASGKSVAELALAEAQQLKIEELYLVRRGSGELVGRWPEGRESEGRDHVMSGILTAINEFSSEALQDEGSTLRQIDLGERQLYLRASQSYLLAAKCSGLAPPDVEAILDEAFLTTLEGIHRDKETYGSLDAAAKHHASVLSGVSQALDQRIDEKTAELTARSGMSPLMLLAWIIGLPLAAWLSWHVYSEYRTERARTAAVQAVADTEGLRGYPTRLSVERLGHEITIEGLAPSAAVKDEAVDRLRRAVPGAILRDELTVLPSGLAEVQPQIEKVRRQLAGLEAEVEPEVDRVKRELEGLKSEVQPEVAKVKTEVASLMATLAPELERVKRSLADIEAQSRRLVVIRAMERAERRLIEVSGDLTRLQSSAGPDGKVVVERARQAAEQSVKDLATARALAAGRGLDGLTGLASDFNALTLRLRESGTALTGLIGPQTTDSARTHRPRELPDKVEESAEELAGETERLASLTLAVSQALALKSTLPAPAPVRQPADPTPRERLESWTRANAIFFGNGTDYRDEARALRALDELAGLMRASDVLLRVVGYTDEKGGQISNTPLSQARAQRVVDALVERRVPSERLVAVGRLDSRVLSTLAGEASPNRRVEFELGFEGERAP